MKTIIKILIILTTVVSMISIYWIVARYTDLTTNELLEKGNWGNVNPIMTLLTGLISITILLISLRYFKPIFQTLKLSKTIKVGFLTSLFFILVATMFWSDSWSEAQSAVLDSRELGDGVWKLGHPLTFFVIDLPIYLRHKNDALQVYWSDFWAYPCVLILFVIQFSIYIQGLRIIINVRKIKTAYNILYK